MTAAPAGFVIGRWPAVGTLDEILKVVHAAFDGLDPPSSVLRETTSDLAARLQTETALVALAGVQIIGSVFCATKDDALYLTRMAVADAWRAQGVGSTLLRAAEDEARQRNIPRLTLRVRQNLPGNRSYFEHRGFVVTGEGQDPGKPSYFSMERVLL